MTKAVIITEEELEWAKDTYYYDPKTGDLVNKKTGCVSIGLSGNGYRYVYYSRGRRRALRQHRIIYLWFTGEQPDILDHINNDRQDNRIENLRPATNQENQRKRPNSGRNRSGYKGVSWTKSKKKWRACATKDYKHVHLGFYDDPIEAAKAYDKFVTNSYGEFSITNKSLGLI